MCVFRRCFDFDGAKEIILKTAPNCYKEKKRDCHVVCQ